MDGLIEKKIRGFIINNFLFGEDGELDGNESFLKRNIIDSTGILELVSFLEKTFDIEIADRELVPDNLDSVNRLVAFIKKKTSLS